MMKSFLTSKEASRYIGVKEEEFLQMVSKNEIPSYKIGGIYTRFKVDDLDSHIRVNRANVKRIGAEQETVVSRVKDFFYFNDFYILSSVSIVLILYLIFK